MTIVAFMLDVGPGWLGGLNYYRNLFSVVSQYQAKDFRIKAFVPTGTDMSIFQDFPKEVEFVPTTFLQRGSFSWLIRKSFLKLFRKDWILSSYLRKHSIDVISHLQSAIYCPRIKTIAWIPDFQHKHLPDFFTCDEIAARDVTFAAMAREMDAVILSSCTAKADFVSYYPQYADKARVLHFVPQLDFSPVLASSGLEARYGVKGRFFFLPNQYWVHKNHKTVIEALHILKEQGRYVCVVSTGSTQDYRVPKHFAAIESMIEKYGVKDRYFILGIIPYADVQSLAEASVGYINPSFFEGWSTTVEEAKYRGKPILLSDLPVHREQAPAKGVFFDPNDAEDLAKKMWDMWQQPSSNESADSLKNINEDALKNFAKDYAEIVRCI